VRVAAIAAVLCVGWSGSAFGQIPKPGDAPAPLSPAEAAKAFKLPAGFRIELVAAEPLVREPSGVCWDERGRLFVCELHGYNLEGQYDIEELNKTGQLDRVVRRIQANEEAKRAAEAETYGTIKLLRDTDGDGTIDRADVWARDLPGARGDYRHRADADSVSGRSQRRRQGGGARSAVRRFRERAARTESQLPAVGPG
jgi:hypothetical protein